MSTLSTNLKILRKNLDVNQEDVVNHLRTEFNLKVNRSMLSKWENGSQSPTIFHIKCLAKLFNVTIDELCGDLGVDASQSPIISVNHMSTNKSPQRVSIMTNIEIENRIKQIRKAIGLRQNDFAAKLGVTVGVISNIELHRNKTSMSDIFISHICNTFNVNPQWIHTGDGDMFVEKETSSFEDLIKTYTLTDDEIFIIKNYLNMPPIERTQFTKMLINMVSKSND